MLCIPAMLQSSDADLSLLSTSCPFHSKTSYSVTCFLCPVLKGLVPHITPANSCNLGPCVYPCWSKMGSCESTGSRALPGNATYQIPPLREWSWTSLTLETTLFLMFLYEEKSAEFAFHGTAGTVDSVFHSVFFNPLEHHCMWIYQKATSGPKPCDLRQELGSQFYLWGILSWKEAVYL